ncbi:unnamed protein product [Closterium sp. NIES-65]|nr:unnamed protein product [Closterium sp. NIES-65]
MVDPPLDAAYPSGKESVEYSSANAPRTVPLRQFLLRRTACGNGGNAAVAPWRIWGCYMGERRGDTARIGAELGMDRVVGEFGYELIAVLPFAYWHHLNGSLRSTTSCGRHSLASIYYFSPNHTDDATCHRSDMKDNVAAYGFPHGIHYSRIPPAWQPPPLAHYFRKHPPVWPEIPKGSRLVVIGNKYEREWGHSPVNFIDIPTLLGIVESYLEAGFYVVYNNPGMSLESDHRQVIKDGTELGDYEALQERFGENTRLQIMQNLQKRWPDLGFNDVQFRMLARSVCFVSVQGGGSIVESYFGGNNIIYFREGQEVKGGAYERIYPQLSGAKVKVVTSYEGLVKKVDGMIKKNKCHAKLH